MLKQQKHVAYINSEIRLMTSQNMLEVPNGLRDTLQQKLDSLTCAKKFTQLASAMGREFDLDILKLSSGQDDEQLQVLLNELLLAELICIQHKTDGKHYVFKNAMLREAAYDSMPKALKREAHKLIASLLESRKSPANPKNTMPFNEHRNEANQTGKSNVNKHH